MNILFKTNKYHHEGPLGAEGLGQLSSLPPRMWIILFNSTCLFY